MAPAPSRLETGANHSHELVVIRGLLKESDGAGLESSFFITFGIARREYDYRNS